MKFTTNNYKQIEINGKTFFKHRLKYLRIKKGLRQKDVAAGINNHINTYRSLENYKISINYIHYRSLCKFFDCDIYERNIKL